ncbi:MAG: sulfurtransferase TusA family protein [Trichlorobacter sp.]
MAMTEMQELVFDLRGRICPSTLLVAMKEMNEHRQELQERAVQLRLLVENRDATVTIPEMARNMGYAVSLNKVEQHYEITISATA